MCDNGFFVEDGGAEEIDFECGFSQDEGIFVVGEGIIFDDEDDFIVGENTVFGDEDDFLTNEEFLKRYEVKSPAKPLFFGNKKDYFSKVDYGFFKRMEESSR